jgi:hypothetical protein
METEEYTPGPAADPGDLTTIDDIDPPTAEALAQVGIRDAADLAATTPATLAKMLREQAGLRVPAKRIESKNWIGQAQARVQRTPPVAPPARAPKWHQQAGFTVFFDTLPGEPGPTTRQTRIYHDESDTEALFPGTDPAPWIAWMLERVDPQAQPVPADHPAPPPAPAQAEQTPAPAPNAELPDAEPPDVAGGAALGLSPPDIMPITVLILDLLEVPSPDGGVEQLIAEVRFRITDSAILIAPPVEPTYQVDIRLVDLEAQTAARIAGRGGQCRRETTEYTAQIPFLVPPPGHYELESIIVLQSADQVQAHYQGQGPRFQVVA